MIEALKSTQAVISLISVVIALIRFSFSTTIYYYNNNCVFLPVSNQMNTASKKLFKFHTLAKKQLCLDVPRLARIVSAEMYVCQ